MSITTSEVVPAELGRQPFVCTRGMVDSQVDGHTQHMVQPKIEMQKKIKLLQGICCLIFLVFLALNLVFTQPKVCFQSTQTKNQTHTKCLPEFSFGWPEFSFRWPKFSFKHPLHVEIQLKVKLILLKSKLEFLKSDENQCNLWP